MDRLEAMVTIEIYGDPEPCTKCGHTMPTILCNAPSCPILETLQKYEPEDDVKALAASLR